LASFEKSLEIAKHRARSHFGAAKAAGLAGDTDRHKAHVAKLAEVCGLTSAAMPAQDPKAVQLSTLPCAGLTR
jgi:hypothetical protein